MVMLENKFKNLVQSKRWSHESYEDKFLALQAKQERMNKAFEKLKRKKEKNGSDAGAGCKTATGKRRGDGKGDGKSRRGAALPDWMSVKPPANKMKEPNEYNGKAWH